MKQGYWGLDLQQHGSLAAEQRPPAWPAR